MSLLQQLNSTLSATLANIAKSDGDELDIEIRRSKAICDVSKQIIASHNVVLEATKLQIAAGGTVDVDKDLLTIGHGGIK